MLYVVYMNSVTIVTALIWFIIELKLFSQV